MIQFIEPSFFFLEKPDFPKCFGGDRILECMELNLIIGNNSFSLDLNLDGLIKLSN
jgi:hypothetical protein